MQVRGDLKNVAFIIASFVVIRMPYQLSRTHVRDDLKT